MDNQHKKTELELIADLLKDWLRHWYYFVISFIICLAIGFLYLKVTIPIYDINARVLIRKDDSSGGLGDMSLMKTLGFGGLGRGSGISVGDEASIMSSHGSIKNVVKQLQLNESYTLSEYFGFKKIDLYDETPIKIEYPLEFPDTLVTVPLVAFSISAKNENVTVQMKVAKFKKTYTLTELPQTIQTPYGPFTFNKTSFYNSYGNSFKLKAMVTNYEFQAQNYEPRLEIESEKKSSDLISLKIQDSNIPRAKAILNGVVEVHNEQATTEKKYVGEQTIRFVSDRLIQVSYDLDSIDNKVKKFKESYQLTNPESDAEAYIDQQAKLMPMLFESKTQLELTKILDDFLADPNNENASIPLTGIMASEAINDAIIRYNEELSKRNEMLQSSKKPSPVSQSLNEQLRSTRANLLSAMKNAKRGLQTNVDILNKKQSELDKRFSNFPVMEKQYVELKREQEVQQAVYIFLQQKKEESAVTSVSVMPRLRMIDDPYSLIKPSSPSLLKTLLLIVFFGGILIPISAVYFIPTISRKKTKSDK